MLPSVDLPTKALGFPGVSGVDAERTCDELEPDSEAPVDEAVAAESVAVAVGAGVALALSLAMIEEASAGEMVRVEVEEGLFESLPWRASWPSI